MLECELILEQAHELFIIYIIERYVSFEMYNIVHNENEHCFGYVLHNFNNWGTIETTLYCLTIVTAYFTHKCLD